MLSELCILHNTGESESWITFPERQTSLKGKGIVYFFAQECYPNNSCWYLNLHLLKVYGVPCLKYNLKCQRKLKFPLQNLIEILLFCLRPHPLPFPYSLIDTCLFFRFLDLMGISQQTCSKSCTVTNGYWSDQATPTTEDSWQFSLFLSDSVQLLVPFN